MNSPRQPPRAASRHRQTQTWQGSSFFFDDVADGRTRKADQLMLGPATSPLKVVVVVAVMLGALALVALGHMLRG